MRGMALGALPVAPVRERGLKFAGPPAEGAHQRRSRKGAWIEILGSAAVLIRSSSRSRKGTWIEILAHIVIAHTPTGTPVRERGLKCECE